MATIASHPDFPTSGTIKVSVEVYDMVGNKSTISDYTFRTKPSCVDLGCCQDVSLQTGNNPSFLYNGFTLNISGGYNPTFTINGNTGTLDCGTAGQGVNIYKGTEDTS